MALHRTDLPPLELLRPFEAVARNLSFTRAAAELFVTQSAVSRQVRTLEEALGVALFERRHRAVVLTEAGQQLYRTTLDVTERLREATRRLRRAGERRSLTVTTTVSFAALWLVPRLPRFTAAHVDVDVRISATNRRLDLARDDVDVAVRFMPADPAHGEALFGETLMPVCSPALARDPSRPLREPSDLRRHVLLMTMDPDAGRPYGEWSEWLDAMALPALEPAGRLHFSQYDLLVGAAMAGQGVAIGRLPLLRQAFDDGRLVAPFGGGRVSPRGYHLLVSPRTRDEPTVAAFVRWLRDEAAQAQARDAVAAAPGGVAAPRNGSMPDVSGAPETAVPVPAVPDAASTRVSRARRPASPPPEPAPTPWPPTPTARRARR